MKFNVHSTLDETPLILALEKLLQHVSMSNKIGEFTAAAIKAIIMFEHLDHCALATTLSKKLNNIVRPDDQTTYRCIIFSSRFV